MEPRKKREHAVEDEDEGTDGDGGGGAAGRGGLLDFLLNPEVVIFFLCMAINGVAGATYDNFVVRERVPQTCDSANGL